MKMKNSIGLFMKKKHFRVACHSHMFRIIESRKVEFHKAELLAGILARGHLKNTSVTPECPALRIPRGAGFAVVCIPRSRHSIKRNIKRNSYRGSPPATLNFTRRAGMTNSPLKYFVFEMASNRPPKGSPFFESCEAESERQDIRPTASLLGVTLFRDVTLYFRAVPNVYSR